MISLVDKAPPITKAYDTSTPAFQDYLEEVITWFDREEGDYASIDAETRTLLPAGTALGFCIALKIAESYRRTAVATDRANPSTEA